MTSSKRESTQGPVESPSKRGGQFKGPKVVGIRCVDVLEMSIAPESGWRTIQQAVIDEYVRIFPEDYGRTISAGVRLLSQEETGGALSVDAFGKFIIDDGKSTAAALQQLKLSYSGVDRSHMLKAGLRFALVCTIPDGLQCTCVFYPTTNV